MLTPATVFLDNAGITYEALRYDHDPKASSFGLEAAEALQLDPAVVFKTLIARLGDARGPMVVAIVPVTDRLDLKALASAAGAKRCLMAEVADAERATGYVAGGISPFGQKRRHATYIDDSATTCERIYVSGGRRGLDLALAPDDLIAALEAIVAPIATAAG